jgi:hypothetical protein
MADTIKPIKESLQDLALWMAEQHCDGYDGVAMTLDVTKPEDPRWLTVCSNSENDQHHFSFPVYESPELVMLLMFPTGLEDKIAMIPDAAKFSHNTYMYLKALEQEWGIDVGEMLKEKTDAFRDAIMFAPLKSDFTHRIPPEISDAHSYWCGVTVRYYKPEEQLPDDWRKIRKPQEGIVIKPVSQKKLYKIK